MKTASFLWNSLNILVIFSACNLELNIQYHWPKFKNYGSQHMVNVQQMGNAEEGSILNNQATYHFDGNLLFKVDYFKQSLPELFLQVSFSLRFIRPDHDIP